MKQSRRVFIKRLMAGAALPGLPLAMNTAASIGPWHEALANQARQLDTGTPLKLLIPHGSSANVKAATDEFTRLSAITCEIEEVPVDEINVELILRSGAADDLIDVALPATFALTDLVQANAILALDDYATKYEPAEFDTGYLYRKGDHYRGKLFGYQTDGDAYLLFYNKAMMQSPSENTAYFEQTGKTLSPATTWQDLDTMMAFFHRPEQGQYGGSLFRNPGYLVWEWWARFHAKGELPFTHDMNVNIASGAGVAALDELIAASDSLSPGSRTNGLFENWADFAKGNVFCNIGWGGTQKYLMSDANMADNLIHSPLPGPMVDGEPSTMGYFNWGWNYTVSTHSSQPELAFLLALFCASPAVSTLAVREPDGFFDPFHDSHYADKEIQAVYGSSFLQAHKQSLAHCLPDLYISGQSNYLDVLRQHILAAVQREMSSVEAMNACAQSWSHITRRLGREDQAQQWRNLVASYPASLAQ